MTMGEHVSLKHIELSTVLLSSTVVEADIGLRSPKRDQKPDAYAEFRLVLMRALLRFRLTIQLNPSGSAYTQLLDAPYDLIRSSVSKEQLRELDREVAFRRGQDELAFDVAPRMGS